MNWNDLTRACLSMDISTIGRNLSMIGDFKAEQGLSEIELLNGFRNPTYTPEAEFHATECWYCLQRIQRFIVIADKTYDPKAKNEDLSSLLRQAFKGTVLDAANCITGVLALISEMAGKAISSTEDAGAYLSKRFPRVGDNFSVFKGEMINTVVPLGAVLLQQQGHLRFYGSADFVFSIEDVNSDHLFFVPRELCLPNGLVAVIPYLLVLLLHVAKCLDLAIKCYLLAHSDPETYAKAAEWYSAPDGDKTDDLPDVLAKVFEKHQIDLNLFASLVNAR